MGKNRVVLTNKQQITTTVISTISYGISFYLTLKRLSKKAGMNE